MWETIKIMLRWVGRIIDFSGSKTSNRINKIYNNSVINWFKTDRKNISSDFRNSIIKISK